MIVLNPAVRVLADPLEPATSGRQPNAPAGYGDQITRFGDDSQSFDMETGGGGRLRA
jgi:hypothetical protein